MNLGREVDHERVPRWKAQRGGAAGVERIPLLLITCGWRAADRACLALPMLPFVPELSAKCSPCHRSHFGRL